MPIDGQKPSVKAVLQQLLELDSVECPADSVSLQEELGALQARHRVIKKTYKTAALAFHPDKPGGSNEAFQSLGTCFEEIDNDFTDQINLIEEQIKTGAGKNVDIISRRRQAFYTERHAQVETATNSGDFYTDDDAAARARARVRSEEYAPFKKKKAATVEGQQPYQASDDKLDDQGKLRVYITVPVCTDHARGLLFGREKTFNLKKVNPNNQLFKESGCLHVASLPDDNAGLVEALKYAMHVSERSIFLVNTELPQNLLDLANNFSMMDHTYGAMSGWADCLKAPAVGVVIVPVDILPSMLAVRSMINSRLSGMASQPEDHVVIKPNYTSHGMIESLFDLVTVDTGAVQVEVVKFDAFHAFASVDEAKNHRLRYTIHDLLNDSVCGDNYDKAAAACRDTTNDLLDQLRLLFIPLLTEGPTSTQSGSSASRMLARFTPKKKLTEEQKAFCQAVFNAQSLDDIVRHLERAELGVTHSLKHNAKDDQLLALGGAKYAIEEDEGLPPSLSSSAANSAASSPARPKPNKRAAALEPAPAAAPAAIPVQPGSGPAVQSRASSPAASIASVASTAAPVGSEPSSLSPAVAKTKPDLSKGWRRAIRIAAGVAGLVLVAAVILTVIAVTKGGALIPLAKTAPWLMKGLITPLANLVTGSVPAAVGVSVAAGASIAASTALTVEPSPKRWFRRRLSAVKLPAAAPERLDELGELEDDQGQQVTGTLAFKHDTPVAPVAPAGNPHYGPVVGAGNRVADEEDAPLNMSPIPPFNLTT